MFDDFCTIDKVYLKQRQEANNTKVYITFQKSENNLVQIEKLLECLEFGDCKKDGNVLDMFGNDETDEDQNEINIDESKTGKTIKTLTIDAPKQYLMSQDISRLSDFTEFCPNLVSLHITLDQNGSITHENIIKLWTNISHLIQLRELQFDMRYLIMESKRVLEIVKHVSELKNLIYLILNFDYCRLSVEDWKLVYSQFSKISKLNSLVLASPYSYQKVKQKEKQIAKTYYKKLLRLVTKHIYISKDYQHEDEEEIGYDLFG